MLLVALLKGENKVHQPKTQPRVLKDFYEMNCPYCGSYRIRMAVYDPYEYECINCKKKIKIEKEE
jgi:DNA-directed RNA polymerase subunit RPC12/RpoP